MRSDSALTVSGLASVVISTSSTSPNFPHPNTTSIGLADYDKLVSLLGTAFAFVHWLDRLRERGRRYALPPGSRLMDTGGFKGRSREVPADELQELISALPDVELVNLLGEGHMLPLTRPDTVAEQITRWVRHVGLREGDGTA